jgi:putative ABC transport system permease protein
MSPDPIRHSLRSLLRDRGFTAAAVIRLVLGLGIGANTAAFSVLYGVVLRPLPYPYGDRLVVLKHSGVQGPANPGVSVRSRTTIARRAAASAMWSNTTR